MLFFIFAKTLSTIIKGALIGISLSAPLGPVGSLCLRKTIFEGRKAGILTGYGATVSDVIYSAIVYVFFGYMLTFLDNNPDLMTGLKSFGGILGGIILIIFARLLYKRARAKVEKKEGEKKAELNPRKEFISSFLLTFSNFWIIFLIWSLYITFGFVMPVETLHDNYWIYSYLAIVAFVSIGAGCLIWWYFFTDIITRISRSLGDKGIKWFVSGVSLVLGIFGVFGILLGLDAFINWKELVTPILPW